MDLGLAPLLPCMTSTSVALSNSPYFSFREKSRKDTNGRTYGGALLISDCPAVDLTSQ